jgi:protein phosphatase
VHAWRPGLLNIGAFAMLTGLSIGALRHYDEIGLLPPAEVDGHVVPSLSPRAGPARSASARCAVDLPIDEIRAVVDADDEGPAPRCAHRARLEEQTRFTDTIETLDDYIENGVRR